VSRPSAIAAGVPDSWRIAEGDEPVTARRCSCPRPIHDTDAGGFQLCVLCGRQPAIRLGAASSAAKPPQIGSSRSRELVRRGDDDSNHLSMTDRKHIGFVAPVDMAVALQAEAARHDRSVSAELRQMIRHHLSESAQPQPDAFEGRAGVEPARGQV
jgi:hypothetical protein